MFAPVTALGELWRSDPSLQVVAQRVIVVRVDSMVRPDLAAVDRLARLQLVARRLGYMIRLRGPSGELRALLDLVGIAGVLPVELQRQAEGAEQLGVEEVVQPGDPPV
jgi:ABC-type transporter Mla MlaB component